MGRHLLLFAALGLVACEDGSSLSALTPELEPLPARIDFGRVYVGAQGQRALILKNIGTGALQVSTVQVEGPGFDNDGYDEGIGPGHQGRVRLRFVPTEVGRSEDQVALTPPAPSGVPFAHREPRLFNLPDQAAPPHHRRARQNSLVRGAVRRRASSTL